MRAGLNVTPYEYIVLIILLKDMRVWFYDIALNHACIILRYSIEPCVYDSTMQHWIMRVRVYDIALIRQIKKWIVLSVCTLLIYLLFHEFSVKPPKILFPLFTMVTVGPLLSNLAWKAWAVKPSRDARKSRCHLSYGGSQPLSLLRRSSFVRITDSSKSFGALGFNSSLELVELSFICKFFQKWCTFW